MSRPRGGAALAALASLAALLSLCTLVDTQTWFSRAVWFIIVVAGTGSLLRRFTARGLLVLAGQLVAVGLVATWTYAGSTTWWGLPTTATVSRFAALFRQFGETVYVSAAPLPANVGVEATLALIGVGIALLVDYLAVSRSAPAAAGLPLLTVFLTATANSGATLPFGFFLVAGAAWLLLLASHAQFGMARWATLAARPMAPVGDGRPESIAATRFGTVARRLGVLALLVAVVVPAVLPHLPTRFVLDGLARSADGRGGGGARVGFSSSLDVSVSLTSGNTQQVMRYRTTATNPAPLRVLATSSYDGTTWVKPDPTLGRASRLDLDPSVPRIERVISVEDYRLDPPALATPQPVTAADFNGVPWQVDETTSDVYVQTRPTSYSTTYLEATLSAALLRDGVDGSTGPDPLPSSRAIAAALTLDPASAALVRATAAQVVGTADGPFNKAAAIQDWLRNKGNFSYALTLAPATDEQGRPLDPITAFLRTKQGYCVQFATAMIMLARAEGIPARMAIGFLPGSLQDGAYTVTAADAHAWPELYFPGAGWVRFEPTPAARTGNAPSWTIAPTTARPTSTAAPSASGSTSRPDTELDRGVEPLDGTFTEVQQPLLDRVRTWLSEPMHLFEVALVLGILGALVLPATALVLRRMRSRRGGPPGQLVEAQWSDFTGRLDDLGVRPPTGATLREVRDHYARTGYLDEASREQLGRLVATVETARYARPGTEVDTELAVPTRELRQAVARTRSWRQRLRAALLPGDAERWWSRVGARLGSVVQRTVGRLPSARTRRPRLRRPPR